MSNTNSASQSTSRAGLQSKLRAFALNRLSLTEKNWEHEIFFQPKLVEEERSRQSAPRGASLLLAIIAALVSAAPVMADDQVAQSGTGAESTSESGSLSQWLWKLFGLGEEEEPTHVIAKNGEDRDPEEGDPL